MKLRQQILLQLSLALGIILSLIFVLANIVIKDRFQKIEVDQAMTNINRAEDALKIYIESVKPQVADWAQWDDTYNHVQKFDQSYVDSNLVAATIANLDINYILIFNNSHKLVSQLFINSQGELQPPDQTLIDFLTNKHPDLITFRQPGINFTGIVNVSNINHTLSSYAISNSYGTATPAGAIIFGRIIDDELIAKLSDTTSLKILFNPPSSPSLINPDISIQSFNLLTIKKTIMDVFDQPVFDLTVLRDRPVFQGYLQTINFFIAILILAFILTNLILYFIIHNTLLRRLFQNIITIKDIDASGLTSERVKITGTDELATLGNSINSMLNRLQTTQNSLQEKIDQSEKTTQAMINILEDEHNLEFSLKKERDQAQTLISSMGEGLLVVDINRKITAINPVAEKLLDLPASQAIGKIWSDLISTTKGQDKTPTKERTFTKSLTEGKTVITKLEDDHYFFSSTGKSFPIISVTAPIINNGQIIGAINLFHNATSEKEAKQYIEKQVIDRTKELNNEKARMTASLTNLPIGFILTDNQNQIVFSNSISQTLLQNHSLLEFSDSISRCKKTLTPVEIKQLVLENKYLHLFFVPILTASPQKECIGAAILIEDITEAKIIERSKDEFFSIASHELRTPLTAIRGNSSLLTEYYSDKITDPNAKEMINDIHEASIRLISIVNDFLDLSRLETGKISFKLETFPVLPLVEEVIKQFTESSPNPQIILINLVTDSSISAHADRERTRQVLTNLIGNAYKYSEKGEIRVSINILGSSLQFDISDTGRGIAPTQQTLLFRKFQQAGENLFTRDTSKSTGLGLYISKLILEGMGGKIWLTSSILNIGSVFSFQLPLATQI